MQLLFSKNSFPGDRQIPGDYNMVFWIKYVGFETKHMDMCPGSTTYWLCEQGQVRRPSGIALVHLAKELDWVALFVQWRYLGRPPKQGLLGCIRNVWLSARLPFRNMLPYSGWWPYGWGEGRKITWPVESCGIIGKLGGKGKSWELNNKLSSHL